MRSLFAIFLIISGGAFAEEHPACLDLPLSKGYTRGELLEIATSCRSPEVADLYFNRAQHISLLNKYIQFERSLVHYGSRYDLSYIESYRIEIALVEAFSTPGLTAEKRPQTLKRLNQVYEQSNEIAELRFRGYDLLADRLLQEFQR